METKIEYQIMKHEEAFLKWKAHVIPFEGGYANDKADAGGETMRGITIGTFNYVAPKVGVPATRENFLAMTGETQDKIMRWLWVSYGCELIENPAIAVFFAEEGWAALTAIKFYQKKLGAYPDGVIGAKDTAPKINARIKNDKHAFWKQLCEWKRERYRVIIDFSVAQYQKKNPNWTEKDLLEWTNKRFEKGWFRRVNDFEKKFYEIL